MALVIDNSKQKKDIKFTFVSCRYFDIRIYLLFFIFKGAIDVSKLTPGMRELLHVDEHGNIDKEVKEALENIFNISVAHRDNGSGGDFNDVFVLKKLLNNVLKPLCRYNDKDWQEIQDLSFVDLIKKNWNDGLNPIIFCGPFLNFSQLSDANNISQCKDDPAIFVENLNKSGGVQLLHQFDNECVKITKDTKDNKNIAEEFGEKMNILSKKIYNLFLQLGDNQMADDTGLQGINFIMSKQDIDNEYSIIFKENLPYQYKFKQNILHRKERLLNMMNKFIFIKQPEGIKDIVIQYSRYIDKNCIKEYKTAFQECQKKKTHIVHENMKDNKKFLDGFFSLEEENAKEGYMQEYDVICGKNEEKDNYVEEFSSSCKVCGSLLKPGAIYQVNYKTNLKKKTSKVTYKNICKELDKKVRITGSIDKKKNKQKVTVKQICSDKTIDENGDLKAKNKRLIEDNNVLMEGNNVIITKLKVQNKENTKLKEEVQKLQKDFDSLNQKKEQIIATRVESKTIKLRNENLEYKDKNLKLNVNLDKAEKQVELLKKKVELLNMQNEILKENNETLKKSNETLKQEKEQIQKNFNETLKNEKEQIQKNFGANIKHCKNSEVMILPLKKNKKNTISFQVSQLNLLGKEKPLLKKYKQQSLTLLGTYSKIKEENQELLSKQVELMRKNNYKEEQLLKNQSEINKLNEEKDKLEKNYNNLKQNYDEQKQVEIRNKNIFNAMDTNYSLLKGKLQDVNKELFYTEKELKKNQDENEKFKNQIDQLSSKQQKIENFLSNYDKYTEDLLRQNDSLESKLKTFGEKNITLVKEVEQKQLEIQGLNNKIFNFHKRSNNDEQNNQNCKEIQQSNNKIKNNNTSKIENNQSNLQNSINNVVSNNNQKQVMAKANQNYFRNHGPKRNNPIRPQTKQIKSGPIPFNQIDRWTKEFEETYGIKYIKNNINNKKKVNNKPKKKINMNNNVNNINVRSNIDLQEFIKSSNEADKLLSCTGAFLQQKGYLGNKNKQPKKKINNNVFNNIYSDIGNYNKF